MSGRTADTVTDVRLVRVDATARSTWFFVEVTTASRDIGVGECSDAGAGDAVAAAVQDAAAAVLGVDVLAESEHVLADLHRRCDAVRDRRRRLLYRTVAGAIDLALCDLAAQSAGVPLWKWLGGDSPGDVPLYANINRSAEARRPQDFADVARQAVADGFRAVKLAPFDGPALPRLSLVETGIACTSAVREAIGDVSLMVDVHNRLDRDELRSVLPMLEDLGVAWLEDAVDVTDVDEMVWLSDTTALPLAGGELIDDPVALDRALATGLLSVLLLDPKHVGGPRALRRLLERVEGVQISYHNPTGPVATLACAHLSTLDPKCALLEFPYGERVDRGAIAEPPEPIERAQLSVPDGPGLGIRLTATARQEAP